MAHAWNKADKIETPTKIAEIDPAVGIIEKTSLEADFATAHARENREVTFPTLRLYESAMSYHQ